MCKVYTKKKDAKDFLIEKLKPTQKVLKFYEKNNMMYYMR